MRKTASLVVGLSITCVLACGVDRQAATHLAQQGISVGQASEASLQTTRGNLTRFVDSTDFLVAFGRPGADAALLQSVGDLRDALAKRAVMMAALANAYSSFSDLASYDASQQVNDSVDALGGAVNDFATALKEPPPISAAAAKIAAAGGGMIAGWVQSHQLKEASALLRQRDESIATLLEKEAKVHRSLATVLATTSSDATMALWRLGIGRPDDILADQLGPWLTYDPAQYVHAYTAMSPTQRTSIQTGVSKVIQARVSRLAELQARTIDATVAGLRALEADHMNLEKGKPLTLVSVTAQLKAMTAFADELRQANTAEK